MNPPSLTELKSLSEKIAKELVFAEAGKDSADQELQTQINIT